MSKKSDGLRLSNRVVHLANERTFLAWIRTSIGVMAFGFVVEKFALFINEISHYFGRQGNLETVTNSALHPGYSSIFGIFLVILGTLTGLFAFFKYKKVERQIEEDTYCSSSILAIVLTSSVVVIGCFLVLYLILS